MNLFFITSNKGKFSEIQAFIPNVQQLDIDLIEVQETDPKKIVEEKLKEAFKQKTGEFIVEDTSLTFEALNGLPGPLIKWFLKHLGTKGLFNLVSKLGNSKAEARTIIGYAKSLTDVQFFDGSISGNIVSPRGEVGFGWDPIFQPEGANKTFSEMGLAEKNKISHRSIAVSKLSAYLKTKNE